MTINGYLWVTFFHLTTWPDLPCKGPLASAAGTPPFSGESSRIWFGSIHRSLAFDVSIRRFYLAFCLASVLAVCWHLFWRPIWYSIWLVAGSVRAQTAVELAIGFGSVCPDCRRARHALLALAVRSGAQGGKYLSEEVREWVSSVQKED